MRGRPAEPVQVVSPVDEADAPPSPRVGGSTAVPRLGLDAGGVRSTVPPGPPGSTDEFDSTADSAPEATPDDAPLLSPVARGLGISFIAAFAVGVLSRVFLRIAIAAVGVAVLMLLGLERGGIIDIHWTVLESQSGGVAGWLAAQTESMRAFLMGALPSAAAAGTGFILGFRRR